ncbi:MAG: cache domain-containing protein [Acidobacteriaceae bacterium]|nr:cache domain-containing protein [Acidobacteriaceae bacterium]MBV9443977.1 cache domain-containing protein [Acidobacteriaceae bacterium]
MDRVEIRVSIAKVLLVLIVVIVPLSVIGLVLTERSDKSLDNAIGNDFKTLAQTYSYEVSEYIRDRVADVNAMAADLHVMAAATKGADAKGGEKGLLASDASQALQQRRNLDPRYLRLVATDSNGNVVAAAQPTTRTSYSEDEDWHNVYNNGQGAVRISDILADEASKAYYVNIGVPIGDPKTGHFAGVLAAAVSITPLLARFQQNQIGNGARAYLVDESGEIISGPNADVFARVKSREYDSIRDSLGSLQGQQSGWQLATGNNGGQYLVGYSATGLKQNFSNLGWSVLVSQEEHQAAAPIRQLERFAIVMVILGLFMLTLLCVYYYLHRAQKFQDLEESEAATRPRTATASI